MAENSNAYRRTQNILNVSTTPSNLFGYRPRSAVADAMEGLSRITSGVVDIKQQEIQNESRELSLQTQLWQLESQDLQKDIRERERAAAAAAAAARRDQAHAYIRANAEAAYELDNALREAGRDPEAIRALGESYIASSMERYEALSPELQNRFFESQLNSEYRVRGNIDTAVLTIAREDLALERDSFGGVAATLPPEQQLQYGNDLIAQSIELGENPGEAADSLLESFTNFVEANRTPAEDVASLNYGSIDAERSFLEGFAESNPHVTGRDQFLQAMDRVTAAENVINTAVFDRIEAAQENLNGAEWANSIDVAVERGLINDDQRRSLGFAYLQQAQQHSQDPERVASRAFRHTNGMLVATEAFPNNPEAQRVANTQINQAIISDLTDPLGNRARLEYHRQNNAGSFTTSFGTVFTRTINRTVGTIAQQPTPGTPEHVEWMRSLYGHVDEINRLRQIGGLSMTSEQHQQVVLIETLIATDQAQHIPTILENLNRRGGTAPVPVGSNAYDWIVDNLPEDSWNDARVMWSVLQDGSNLGPDVIEDTLESAFQMQSFRGTTADWSPAAVTMLTESNVGPATMRYVEPTLLDRELNMFDEDTYSHLETIFNGNNVRFMSYNGQLAVRSDTGFLPLPFNDEQMGLVTSAAQQRHDIANRPAADRLRSTTSVSVERDIGNVIEFGTAYIRRNEADFPAHVVERQARELEAITSSVRNAEDALVNTLNNGGDEETAYRTYSTAVGTAAEVSVRTIVGTRMPSRGLPAFRAAMAAEQERYLNDQRSGLLNIVLNPFGLGGDNPFGRPTDGLYQHMVEFGTRWVEENR